MTRIAIALTPDFADWECALLMAVARSYLGVEILTASPESVVSVTFFIVQFISTTNLS